MRRRWRWLAVMSVALGCGGCQEAPPPARDAAAVIQPSAFVPPADGRLSEAQIAMYLEVAAQAASESPSLPTPGDGEALFEALTARSEADGEAARRLGHDPAEYRWVQARVMEARLPPNVLAGLADRVAAAAREARDDPETGRARLAPQGAGSPAGGSDSEGLPSARDHNRELLESQGALGPGGV